MDRGLGSHHLRRSSAGPTPVLIPLDVPLSGRSAGPDAGRLDPCFAGTHQDQPIEDVFSRLSLSFGSGGGGGGGGGSVLDGYGPLPVSWQRVQPMNGNLESWSSLRSGIGGFGDVGLGSHEVRGGAESRDSFLGFPSSLSVSSEPSVDESGKRSFGAERYAFWNQSPRPEYAGSAVPIMPRSNQNRPLRGPMVDYRGQVDGLLSENLTTLRSASYNRGLHNHFNRQLQQYLSVNYFRLEDLRGRIMPLAMNQHGCKFLQENFQHMSDEGIEMIFLEVIPHVPELILDQFGNYIVQKLVEFGNEEQRTQILLSITSNQYQLIFICLNMHGTRVMQKLLEHLTTPEQVSIAMSALWPVTVPLTKDTSGHHVIQHCLKLFPCQDNMYILKEVADNCFEIATNRSGCCVMQTCVENSKGEFRDRIIAEIIANALPLAEDRYGNYVVQHLMGMRIQDVTTKLLKQFEGSFISLSCNKYGSNVVEKLLMGCNEEESSQIIIELLRNPNVSMLLLDPFGNFVIQSALSVSKGIIRNALVNVIRTNVQSMHSNLYGKKVLTWFDKRKLQHLYM